MTCADPACWRGCHPATIGRIEFSPIQYPSVAATAQSVVIPELCVTCRKPATLVTLEGGKKAWCAEHAPYTIKIEVTPKWKGQT